MFRFRAIILAAVAIMLSVVAFNPSSANASILTPGSASASYAHFTVVEPVVVNDKYTVKTGDTLSSIAENHGGTWPQWYCDNAEVIGVNPNLITTGEHLATPSSGYRADCHIDIPQTQGGNNTSTVTPRTQPYVSHVSAHVADDASQRPSVQQPIDQSYSGSSSMQECIISRESGGNSQIMNASGHYGLYQFSEGTWIAYGGSPSTFGNASVAEQNQVFDNAVAQSGYSAWTPYDGC